MAKKILSEAVVRRFAKLANLPTVNESVYQEEETVEETITPTGRTPITEEEDELDLGGEEAPPMPDEGPPLPEEDPMDDMMGGEGELDLTDEEAQAIIDLGKKLEAAMPPGGEEEMELDAEAPPMDDLDGGEPPMPPGEPEEEIMEALSGINYVPAKKEIVEEVARRVARRLLKAKRAEKNLDEALGRKRRAKTNPRRRIKK